MRSAFVALTFFALPLSAANIWFDPPNPTSRTPVVAHVVGAFSTCMPDKASVTRNGQVIAITVMTPQCPPTAPLVVGFDMPVDLGVLPAGVYGVVASPNNLLVLIGEAKLTVADAAPPLQVQPNVAVITGDEVRIAGADLVACSPPGLPLLCETPVVKFGDVVASVISVRATDEIVVFAPKHQPGTVDVTVQNARGTARAIAGFHYFNQDEQPDPAFFEPVLLPVMITGPGAFGSFWTTITVLRNENDFRLTTMCSLFGNGCDVLGPCDSRPLPHSTVGEGATLPSGALFYIPREASPRVFLGTFVSSHGSGAPGTEIPVVREKDFFDRPFTLLNVPNDQRYRVALRIYRIEGVISVRVRIRPLLSEEAPLVDTLLFLATRSVGVGPHMMIYVPDLLTTYPQLAGKGVLRIDIDPMSPERGTWAFVSVTNNETQAVRVISPQ